MWPTLLRLGDFHLATYGVLVAAGFFAGIVYYGRQKEAKELGEPRFQGLITGLFLTGMGGGKLLYLALYWRDMDWSAGSLLGNLRFGFVYLGGFLGALAYGAWFVRRHRLSFWKLADPAAVGLALGHGIGRLGCLAAGCCFGRPTALPWGLAFKSAEALVPGQLLGVPLHPTQLYESLGNFALAAVLHFVFLPRIRAGRWREGAAFLAYMLGYSVLRFAVECVRADDRGFYAFGLSVSQCLALALTAAVGVVFVRRHHDRGGRSRTQGNG